MLKIRKNNKNNKNNGGNVIKKGASSIKNWFSTNLEDAKKQVVGKLIINVLFCVISAIAIFFLFSPVQELKSAYNEKNSQVELLAQKAKADEATDIYVKVKRDYKNNENPIIKAYAENNTNDVLVGVVAFLLAVPFISIVIMLFKDIKLFVFAVLQIVIVTPVTFVARVIKAIFAEIASIHAEKKASKKIAKHSENNNVNPKLIDVVVSR